MVHHLISPEDLARIIDDRALRLVDCRWYIADPDEGAAAYRRAHLPGAVHASLDDHLSGTTGPGRHPLPSPDEFAETLSSFGISPESTVVVYDDRGGAIASRLWWMLTAQGHAAVAVLDGGIQAWTMEGRPLTTDVPALERTQYEVVQWTGIVTLEEVAEREPGTTVIDAREPERYRGDIEPIDSKAGHIPGAVSLPVAANLDENSRFRPSSDLAWRFSSIGVAGDTRVIAHCGSGVTACHTILAAEIAGLGRPDLYVGSWSEWSGTDRPVATGEAP
ncbi:MAG TPA: sulfurtransferase [Acidimicrobiia bacterium]|nr:sulfurtransferase [Acidimicrobiia bacterium]